MASEPVSMLPRAVSVTSKGSAKKSALHVYGIGLLDGGTGGVPAGGMQNWVGRVAVKGARRAKVAKRKIRFIVIGLCIFGNSFVVQLPCEVGQEGGLYISVCCNGPLAMGGVGGSSLV